MEIYIDLSYVRLRLAKPSKNCFRRQDCYNCHLADPIIKIKIDHPDNESGGMTYMSLRPFPLVGAQV